MVLLSRMPVAKLRAGAEARGIALPSRASRVEIARLLVRHQLRSRPDRDYRETGVAFSSRASEYPPICRTLARYRLRSILDIGCGPGLFAEELRRSNALARDGAYLGLDLSAAAVDMARQLLAGDARFTFDVGDAVDLGEHARLTADGIVLTFLLGYLDTHEVHALYERLARVYPRATVFTALSFRASVDRLEGVEPDEQRELRAARKYLAGDATAAKAIWDVRRFACYRQSVNTFFRIVEERTLRQEPRIIWVAAPRPRRARSR